MFRISVAEQTLKQLDRRRRGVRELIKDANDRRKVLKRIQFYMAERWMENFNSDGSIYGRWKGLAAATQNDRVLRGFSPNDILYRTGALGEELSNQVINEARLNAASVTWNFHDTDESFPVAHHFGYPNPNTGRSRTSSGRLRPKRASGGSAADIPARTLWGINAEDEDEIALKIENWMEELFNKHLG